MPLPPKKSLPRSLGEFFGHILHAVRASPGPSRQEVRRTIEHETRDTPAGAVTLRRTTIEEIEVPPPRAAR